MFKPSFDSGPVSRNSRPDLPPSTTSLPSLGGILSNSIALPEPRLAGLFSPQELPPLCVSPRPDKQESLFLRELGPVGFYYGIVYRLFDLGCGFVFLYWLCLLSAGDVFLLGSAFAGVIGLWLSGPWSHLLVVSTYSTGRRIISLSGRVRGF